MTRWLLGKGRMFIHAPVVLLTASMLAVVGNSTPSGAGVIGCGGLPATIIGTSGSDHLVGTEGADVIVGLGGPDLIEGRGGGDYICGGGKGDTLEGGGGDDRIWGGGGDDALNGGPGNDRTIGGSGTDSCAGAETTKGCEAIPPVGCTPDAPVEAIANTSRVELIGSNALATQSSFLIDGEGRRLTFVAELRNDTNATVRLGRGEITIYNGSGNKIGTRYPYAMADALKPGQTTALVETMPSIIYWSGETNGFPGGWASWKLTLNATTGEPSVYADVILKSKLRSLRPESGGRLTGTGNATNSLGRPIDSVTWWVALHDAAGRLINVASDYEYFTNDLAPGDRASFEVTILSDVPTCFTTVSWGAAGS